MTISSPPRVVEQRAGGRPSGTWYRHPSDVARLVFALLIVGVLVLLHLVAADSVRAFSVDVIALVDGLPDAIADGMVGLVQLAATVLPIAIVVWLLLCRRYQFLIVLGVAAALAATAMALFSGLVEGSVPIDDLPYDNLNSWFIGSQYPSSTYLAALAAVLVAGSPWLRRASRVTGWLFIVALVVARAVTATEVPLRNGLLLAIGAASGSLALVVFGAPRRRVDLGSVGDALRNSGLDVSDLTPMTVAAGDDPRFVASTASGEAVTIKVLGRDQRDADLLLAAWRAITVKGLGDGGAIRSPARAVEREALASSLFTAVGVATPTPIAVVETHDEMSVLATSAPVGRPLVEVGEFSDEMLAELWGQLARLQHRRLAHRALNTANIFVDGDRVSLVDLRRADLHASDEVLGADVAELLVSLSLLAGIDRVVASARDQLGEGQLARAVPLVQRAVLSRWTRDRLDAGTDDADDYLAQLRDAAAAASGVVAVDVAPVQRITVRGVVSLAGSAMLVWYIGSVASDWDQIWDAFSGADLVYIIPVLLVQSTTYVTGAMSMAGAVPVQLRLGRTSVVMLGQSYLNRFTPANAGGMAMRVRYLQLEGLDAAVAATSIGLTSAASGVAQGLMIVIFLLWGGASDRFDDFEFPDIGSIVLVVLVIGLVATIVLASTWGRRVVRPWLAAIATRIVATIGELAHDPRKMGQLLGGAVLGKLAGIVAFWLSIEAFGVDITFPKAGALYIVANTFGSAVPTPGGVGGVDAALTAALLSYGVDPATAAAIVLFLRILTFWLPTLPGFAMMRYAQRTRIV